MVLTPQQPAAPPRPAAAPPRPAPGTELLGEAQGSGFRKPPYLVRRADGQVLQLTRLLHLVAEHCDGSRSYADVASAVSREFGRRVSAGNVRTLVEDKLRPLGVLVRGDGSAPELTKPDPLLALKLRKGVLPPRVVRAITTLCYPLFFPPVVIAALVALAAVDWWLFGVHGIAQGVRETVMNPLLFVGMLGLVVASAFFHECGHATGCRYGGGEPGEMGAGIYLVFPAFYTDVTDAYRLSRGARLRTDLGGVYFNALFMLATFGAYLATGFEPLLFLILVQHVEIAHQFLPFLRLDGYYVVADLVGVPDLFARIGPILKSFLPGRRDDPRVAELKPWVRLVVTGWVLLVIPFLLFNLGMLLLHLPRFLATGAESLGKQWAATTAALGDGDLLVAAGGVLQVVALALPLAGLVYTFSRVGARAARRAWAWSADSLPRRGAVVAAGAAVAALLVRAWLPDGQYRPIGPGERGTIGDAVRAAHTVVTTGTVGAGAVAPVEPGGGPVDPGGVSGQVSPTPDAGTTDAEPSPAGSPDGGDPTTTTQPTATPTSGEQPSPSPTASSPQPEPTTTPSP